MIVVIILCLGCNACLCILPLCPVTAVSCHCPWSFLPLALGCGILSSCHLLVACVFLYSLSTLSFCLGFSCCSCFCASDLFSPLHVLNMWLSLRNDCISLCVPVVCWCWVFLWRYVALSVHPSVSSLQWPFNNPTPSVSVSPSPPNRWSFLFGHSLAPFLFVIFWCYFSWITAFKKRKKKLTKSLTRHDSLSVFVFPLWQANVRYSGLCMNSWPISTWTLLVVRRTAPHKKDSREPLVILWLNLLHSRSKIQHLQRQTRTTLYGRMATRVSYGCRNWTLMYKILTEKREWMMMIMMEVIFFLQFCGLYMKMQLQECFRKWRSVLGGEKWKSIYFSFHMHFLNKKKTQRGLFTQSCKLFYTPAFKRKCWTFARNFISFLFYNTKYQYFCVLGLCSLVHYLNVALSPPFYVSIWTFHLSLSL